MSKTCEITESKFSGCPLCGEKVKIKGMFDYIHSPPGCDHDVLAFRMKIKCEDCFLTMDVGINVRVDSEKNVVYTFHDLEDKVAERWNKRANKKGGQK